MPRARDAPNARLARRKEALKKKAHDLATRCGVDVAVVYEGSVPGDAGLYWPSKEAVMAAARRYGAVPLGERARYTADRADNFESWLSEERAKLLRAQESGVAGALGSWDGSLEGMGEEELRELLASIDVSLAAPRNRGLEGQPRSGGAADHARIPPGPAHADEVTTEASVSVRARGATNGARRLLDGADAGGIVSGLPQEENPTSPDAAALVTPEKSVSATARTAGNGVWPRLCEVDALELPLEETRGGPNAAHLDAEDAAAGQDESDQVQILQPPADTEADDAQWMQDLVEALKVTSPPSNTAETEYMHMNRGYAMERDTYDFISFDLGIPPPCIGCVSSDSDDDEPLKLWSRE